jgi:hypothetical protein
VVDASTVDALGVETALLLDDTRLSSGRNVGVSPAEAQPESASSPDSTAHDDRRTTPRHITASLTRGIYRCRS